MPQIAPNLIEKGNDESERTDEEESCDEEESTFEEEERSNDDAIVDDDYKEKYEPHVRKKRATSAYDSNLAKCGGNFR
jgi:hypothetical protein